MAADSPAELFKRPLLAAEGVYVTSVDLRCPTCNAHVVAGAQWCTLCYADLRPAPEPVEEPVTVAAQHASAPYGGQVAASGTRSADASAEPPTGDLSDQDRKDAEAAAAAEMMLAQLAATSAAPLGGVGSHFQSNGAKVALIAGGSVLFIAVLFAIMMVIGAVLPAK